MQQRNKRSATKTAAMLLLPCTIASLTACKQNFTIDDPSGCQSLLAHGVNELYAGSNSSAGTEAIANWFCKTDLTVQANLDAALDVSSAIDIIFSDRADGADLNTDAQAYQAKVCEMGVNYNSDTSSTWELQWAADEELLDRYEACWANFQNEVELLCHDGEGNNPAVSVQPDGIFLLNFHPEGEGLHITDIKITDTINVIQKSLASAIPEKMVASSSIEHGNAVVTMQLENVQEYGSLVVRSHSDQFGAIECALSIEPPALPRSLSVEVSGLQNGTVDVEEAASQSTLTFDSSTATTVIDHDYFDGDRFSLKITDAPENHNCYISKNAYGDVNGGDIKSIITCTKNPENPEGPEDPGPAPGTYYIDYSGPQNYSPEKGGDNKGTYHSSVCPVGKVMTGIKVRAGSEIDGFKAICRTLNQNGYTANDPSYANFIGTNDGSWRNDDHCTNNGAITRFWGGTSGGKLARFWPVCDHVSNQFLQREWLELHGSGTNYFGFSTCPFGEVATGIRIRNTESAIYKVKLLCNPIKKVCTDDCPKDKGNKLYPGERISVGESLHYNGYLLTISSGDVKLVTPSGKEEWVMPKEAWKNKAVAAFGFDHNKHLWGRAADGTLLWARSHSNAAYAQLEGQALTLRSSSGQALWNTN